MLGVLSGNVWHAAVENCLISAQFLQKIIWRLNGSFDFKCAAVDEC